MPPANIYNDDAALFAFLDDQIAEADENPIRRKNTPHTPTDTFSTRELREGLSAANSLLEEGSICKPLPGINSQRDNVPDILAAALTAIVRLSKCCRTNVNLRNDAEGQLRALEARNDGMAGTVEGLKARITRKDTQLAALQNKLAELEGKHKRQVRKLNAESTDLKNRLTGAGHRENHYVLEASKREKQYAHLQQRVHALLSSTKKLSLNPQITVASEFRSGDVRTHPMQTAEDVEAAYVPMMEEADDSRIAELTGENDEFRNLLRAIQEELDDLLVQHPSLFPGLSMETRAPKDTSEVSDVSDGSDTEGEHRDDADVPIPAPSVEQMSMPFAMIREEFESSLEQKFQMVREALSKSQL